MGSDFLFAVPSWLSGAARSLDLAGQFDEYNDSQTTQAADAKALFCDWRVIGESLLEAVRTLGIGPQASSSTPSE
jgi:hypothetical protein